MTGLAVGQPSWLSSSVGTAPARVHGRTAVHHRGRSDAKRQGDAFLCEKRNGSGQYVIRAGSGELGEAPAARSSVVHQHASRGRRRPACNMLPVMRGRADTCTARLAAVLDTASISGSSAEPGRCGRAMITLYPGQRERRPQSGDAALLEVEVF